jgi:hypothetical protein
VDTPGAAVALIIGGCLVGLATGNMLVILQNCARRARRSAVDRHLATLRQHRRHPVANHHRRADCQSGGSYTPPRMAAALIAPRPLAFCRSSCAT